MGEPTAADRTLLRALVEVLLGPREDVILSPAEAVALKAKWDAGLRIIAAAHAEERTAERAAVRELFWEFVAWYAEDQRPFIGQSPQQKLEQMLREAKGEWLVKLKRMVAAARVEALMGEDDDCTDEG